jgi:hypothetical protein
MNSSTPESAPLPTDGARTPAIALGAAQKSTSVVTSMMVFATPAHVWDSLVFYEGLDEAPPLYLRLLLPRPIRTEGAKSAVGDQATCLYQGGHLLKQLTAIEPQRLYEFKVVEQNLMIGGNVRLTGGCYALRELPGGDTELSITTGYVSRNRPRWLVRPVEEAVCHLFHRHLLGAIKRKAEGALTPGIAQA